MVRDAEGDDGIASNMTSSPIGAMICLLLQAACSKDGYVAGGGDASSPASPSSASAPQCNIEARAQAVAAPGSIECGRALAPSEARSMRPPEEAAYKKTMSCALTALRARRPFIMARGHEPWSPWSETSEVFVLRADGVLNVFRPTDVGSTISRAACLEIDRELERDGLLQCKTYDPVSFECD